MDNNNLNSEECDSTRVKKGLKCGGGDRSFRLSRGRCAKRAAVYPSKAYLRFEWTNNMKNASSCFNIYHIVFTFLFMFCSQVQTVVTGY